jgi:acetylglutamate kinase
MAKSNEIHNVLIKVSGDLADSDEFFNFVIAKAKKNFVVVICGGGTKINQELKNKGFEPHFCEPHGRITDTWQERKIARDVLENEQKRLQDKFVGKGVTVIPPLLIIGSVICHINGDNMIKASYLGFSEIYVFTLEERLEAKKQYFKECEKVKIITIKKPGI